MSFFFFFSLLLHKNLVLTCSFGSGADVRPPRSHSLPVFLAESQGGANVRRVDRQELNKKYEKKKKNHPKSESFDQHVKHVMFPTESSRQGERATGTAHTSRRQAESVVMAPAHRGGHLRSTHGVTPLITEVDPRVNLEHTLCLDAPLRHTWSRCKANQSMVTQTDDLHCKTFTTDL